MPLPVVAVNGVAVSIPVGIFVHDVCATSASMPMALWVPERVLPEFFGPADFPGP